MHVREHFIVDDAREARELIAVPCADDGVAAEQCAVDAVGILRGLPTDRCEQFVNLVLREAFLVRVFDCHSCRLYRGAYISLYQMGEWETSVCCVWMCVSCGAAVCGDAGRWGGIGVARWWAMRYRWSVGRCWRRAVPQCAQSRDGCSRSVRIRVRRSRRARNTRVRSRAHDGRGRP